MRWLRAQLWVFLSRPRCLFGIAAEELRKRGVTVVPEFSVRTPTGVLKPDILLKNGAPYIVETKLGAETKLLEAMVKLYDYSKYVTEAKRAFAIPLPQNTYGGS